MERIKDFIETALIIIFSLVLLLLMIVDYAICRLLGIEGSEDEL